MLMRILELEEAAVELSALFCFYFQQKPALPDVVCTAEDARRATQWRTSAKESAEKPLITITPQLTTPTREITEVAR